MARCAIRRGLIALALAASPAPDDAPSLALLLHLAEYGEAGGEALDPIAVDAMLGPDEGALGEASIEKPVGEDEDAVPDARGRATGAPPEEHHEPR